MSLSLEQDGWGRNARSRHDSLTHLPADAKLRPLRDQIILEVTDVVLSRTLIVPNRDRPERGRIIAVGRGKYETRYNHREKHKRTKSWESNAFVRTAVKVGDTVQLEPGRGFDGFWWGDKYCIICSERDVAGVVEG